VGFVGGDAGVFVLKVGGEPGFQRLPNHCVPSLIGLLGDVLIDRLAGTCPPGFAIPQREQDLGMGERDAQLLPERGDGPIDTGHPVRHQSFPIDGLPIYGGLPRLDVLQVIEQLEHVIAGAA